MKLRIDQHLQLSARFYLRNLRLRTHANKTLQSSKEAALVRSLHKFFDCIEARYGKEECAKLYWQSMDYALAHEYPTEFALCNM